MSTITARPTSHITTPTISVPAVRVARPEMSRLRVSIPKSTAETLLAQFRPLPFAHAIQSHAPTAISAPITRMPVRTFSAVCSCAKV